MAQMTITQFMTGIKNWVLGKIRNITALIPSQASSSNQLADKAFVNSSIATATATFRGTYNVVSDLSLSYNATHAQIQTALATKMSALSITPDNNDYAFVQIPTADATPTQIAKIERYKYSGSAWAFEYELNNSGFTAAQWAAINSGITGTKVTKLDALPTNAELTTLLAGKQNVLTFDNAPTENSNNPVKSGGIYTAIVNTIAAIRSWALGLFARKDGSYDTLSAGSAKDLEGDVVDNNTFLFRKSGGLTSVAKGNALVNTIKGNTVAWNQLVQNGDFSNGTNKWAATGIISVSDGVLKFVPYGQYNNTRQTLNIVSGHKYFFRTIIKVPSEIGEIRIGLGSTSKFTQEGCTNSMIALEDFTSRSWIGTYNKKGSENFLLIMSMSSGEGRDYSKGVDIKEIEVIDLTLMFGAGNEPESVEAFESWLAQNIGLKNYYPYNAGELISCNMQGIKTVGFNQWDEEWELGTFQSRNGSKLAANDKIRSKNKIPVFPNTTYYVGNNTFGYFEYDADGNYIPMYANQSSPRVPTNGVFTTTERCRYINFRVDGTTYNHDICINISDTDKNGTYEPYWTETKDFDVKKVYGKLNGEGSLVQVFPNGMRSAGSIHDVLNVNQAIVNIGSVNMGTLTWYYHSADGRPVFDADISNMKNSGYNTVVYNIVCGIYKNVLWGYNRTLAAYDKTIAGGGIKVSVRDSSYEAASAFKTAMNGIMLNYELAESLTYTDLVYRDNGVDVPLEGINYKVDTLGTEEIVVPAPPSGADADTVTSCAPTMAIAYGMNAVKTIQNLNSNFVSPKQAQTFTDAEKTQARSNIGAASLSDVRAMFASLPTTDPQTAGSLWNDNGVVKISVGGEE